MNPTLALIINTSNQPEYLARVLRGVAAQSQPPDEVLLADDGSGEETRQLFKRWSADRSIRTEHLWQEQKGFRRAQILNEAIVHAQAGYLVFLDGDTVPHPRFIADHEKLAQRGRFVQGHRALVEQRASIRFGMGHFGSERLTALLGGQLHGLKHAFRWPVPLKRVRSDLRGVRGCNLAIWRQDLARVNGYNEAFVGWGREDSELVARLYNAGLERLDVRGWALCYHLWHPPASRGKLSENDKILEATLTQRLAICQQGMNLHQPGPGAANV